MRSFFLILIGLLCSCTRTPPRDPDIIVFNVDTLRADHLGVYGHSRATSPALDALAAESLVFERAFSHSSWTLPATASLLTGLHPLEHGATRDPDDEFRYARLQPEIPTLAELLQARGYRTGAWVNNVYLAPQFGLDQGFQRFDYNGSSGIEERGASETVAAALQWMRESPEPTFLYIHLMEPHLPYLPPVQTRRRFTGPGEPLVPVPFGVAEHLGKLMNRQWIPSAQEHEYIRKLYDEEILASDQAFGELVAGLRGLGRWDRTVVAFTADHGEEFWDHDGFEHGHTLFGEILRVPLVLRVPGRAPARIGTTARHIDLFRTLLGLGGVTSPAHPDARDLLAPTNGPPVDVLSEDCLYGPPLASITREDSRLIVNLRTRVARLYRLDSKGQGDLLIPDSPEQQAQGAALLQELSRIRGDLETHTPKESTRLDQESIDRLRALGYIQE